MREAYVPSGEAELVAPGRSLAEATRRRMDPRACVALRMIALSVCDFRHFDHPTD